MKIKDIHGGKVYYGTEGEEFEVTYDFWQALRNNKVQYRTASSGGGVVVDLIKILSLKDSDFTDVFRRIIKSGIGELVLSGQMPVTTIL